MTSRRAVVAILVSNPALSALLAATLASSPQLRVRPFDSEIALSTYMRLASVDVVVADFDDDVPADALARRLRGDERLETPGFQMLALTARMTSSVKAAAVLSGIDEVIVKPMSPRYLLERVTARLVRRASLRRMPQPGWPANVVPLFPGVPQPNG